MTSVDALLSDWASPPGATIASLIKKNGIELPQLGEAIGIGREDVERLLAGSLVIDSLMAQELSAALGGSVGFWLKRESDYREALVKSCEVEPKNWIKQFPLREMKQWGWITETSDDFNELLNFFGVTSPRSWHGKYKDQIGDYAFRRAQGAARIGLVTSWLRHSEQLGERIACKFWDAKEFRRILNECKPLSYERDPSLFIPRLQSLCAGAGVAVVFARSPSGSGISGATRFVTPEKALLCLSLRHLSDDHLWFTFFHEAGHLLLHKSATAHLEGDSSSSEQQEREANQFAREVLVPNEFRANLIAAKNSRYEIARLAKRLRISPGILVGQLQKDGLIPFSRMNNMKRRYKWPSLDN